MTLIRNISCKTTPFIFLLQEVIAVSDGPWKASDTEVLEAVATADAPVITSGQLADALDMSQQAAYSRLETFEDRGWVRSKKVGSAAKVYWLTQEGRDAMND
jgi:predicted ArsR family transcriptional regulator